MYTRCTLLQAVELGKNDLHLLHRDSVLKNIACTVQLQKGRRVSKVKDIAERVNISLYQVKAKSQL